MPGIYVKNYPTCRLYLMAVQSYTPPTMPATTTTTVPGGQGQAPPTNSNITHGGLAMATRLPIKGQGQVPPHKKHRALPSKLYKCRVIRQDTRDAKAHIQFVTWMLSREDLMVVFGI